MSPLRGNPPCGNPKQGSRAKKLDSRWSLSRTLMRGGNPGAPGLFPQQEIVNCVLLEMKFIRRFTHERFEMKMDINVIDDEDMFILTFFEG